MNIKYGAHFRSINSQDKIFNNKYIVDIDNYIKKNYLNSDGYFEILVDTDYLGSNTKKNFEKLERYIRTYLKFHNIFFESFRYSFDKENNCFYFNLCIDLNFPYLD